MLMDFNNFWQECSVESRRYNFPPCRISDSALPCKTGKHGNCIFLHQLCVALLKTKHVKIIIIHLWNGQMSKASSQLYAHSLRSGMGQKNKKSKWGNGVDSNRGKKKKISGRRKQRGSACSNLSAVWHRPTCHSLFTSYDCDDEDR